MGFTFVMFSVLTPITADKSLGCDEGWANANGYCYLFYNKRRVSRQQAANECDRYDSSLLYFDNKEEEVKQKWNIAKTGVMLGLHYVPGSHGSHGSQKRSSP